MGIKDADFRLFFLRKQQTAHWG